VRGQLANVQAGPKVNDLGKETNTVLAAVCEHQSTCTFMYWKGGCRARRWGPQEASSKAGKGCVGRGGCTHHCAGRRHIEWPRGLRGRTQVWQQCVSMAIMYESVGKGQKAWGSDAVCKGSNNSSQTWLTPWRIQNVRAHAQTSLTATPPPQPPYLECFQLADAQHL
jgi:hypothetical protein